LKQRLPDPRNTILLGGYMAEGTRGRQLQDGAPTIRIYGEDVPVRAAIERVSALSGHAGRGELLRWLEPLPAPMHIFITHGELSVQQSFAAALRERWPQSEVNIPRLNQGFEV
jgi:metallo-beta-lactamase family protein